MGNVTNDGSHTYSYDAERRPTGIDKSGNNGTVIYYDAFGRAVTINTNGTYTQILYDPNGGRFALMSGQSVQHYYLPLVAGVQAVYDSTGLKYYRHADWLGSSRLQIDASGNLLGGMAYAPYGETYDQTGSPERVFTGQTQDVIKGTTGIYDFLFRQQASNQGRWLVPDPAGLAAVDLTNPQTWNRYAYVGNNPLSRVDPLGLRDCLDINGNVQTNCTDDLQNYNDRSQPPARTGASGGNGTQEPIAVYWGGIGPAPAQPGGLNPYLFKNGKWQCTRTANGGWQCTGLQPPPTPNPQPIDCTKQPCFRGPEEVKISAVHTPNPSAIECVIDPGDAVPTNTGDPGHEAEFRPDPMADPQGATVADFLAMIVGYVADALHCWSYKF